MPLTSAEVRRYIREGRNSARSWHERSRRNRRFFDGDSWDAQDRKILEDRDQKAVVVNIVKPAVGLVSGMLACPQLDFTARALVASPTASQEATWGLKHLATVNDVDLLKRQAGEESVIEGVGWLMTGLQVRDRNPLAESVQVAQIPARWTWYELDARDVGLRDARYMGLSRWFRIRQATRLWPKFKEQLESLQGIAAPPEGSTQQIEVALDSGEPADAPLPPLYLWGEQQWNRAEQDGELDRKKHMVMVHELFYMDEEQATFYVTTDGQTHRMEPGGEGAMLARQAEIVRFFEAAAPTVRVARMCGPYVLEDVSLQSATYPMHPFFWDRDLQGRPYSFVQQISDQQQEVNGRRARAYFEAAGQRIQVDDAYLVEHSVEDLEDVKSEAAKPNGVIIGSGIMPWPKDVADHMAFVQLAKAEVHEAAGITENLAGTDAGLSPKSAEAARQKTLQSGMTFERHRLDFLFSYRQVGKRLLELMLRYHPEPWPVLVNNPVAGDAELALINPDNADYMLDIEAEPFSPTMRDRWVDTMLGLLPKLPPDAQLQAEATLGVLQLMDLPGVSVLETALRGYLGRYQQAQAMAGALPANLEAAAQGAHRPRQPRVGDQPA